MLIRSLATGGPNCAPTTLRPIEGIDRSAPLSWRPTAEPNSDHDSARPASTPALGVAGAPLAGPDCARRRGGRARLARAAFRRARSSSKARDLGEQLRRAPRPSRPAGTVKRPGFILPSGQFSLVELTPSSVSRRTLRVAAVWLRTWSVQAAAGCRDGAWRDVERSR